MKNLLTKLVCLAGIVSSVFLFDGCKTAEKPEIDWKERRANYLIIGKSFCSCSGYNLKRQPVTFCEITEEWYFDKDKNNIFETCEKRVYSVDIKNNRTLKSRETKTISAPYTKQELLEQGAFREEIGTGPY